MFSICFLLKLSAELAGPKIKSYHFVANPCDQSGRFMKIQNYTKTGRLMGCTGRCVATTPCSSLEYNISSRECRLFDTGIPVHSTPPTSSLQTFSSEQLLERGVKTRTKLTGHFKLVNVGRKIKEYSKMNKTCNEHSGRLPKIDSQKKWNVLLKLIRSTKQDIFPIGVYELNGAWSYIDGTPVTYMHSSIRRMGKGTPSKGGFVGVMIFGWVGFSAKNAMGPSLICEI